MRKSASKSILCVREMWCSPVKVECINYCRYCECVYKECFLETKTAARTQAIMTSSDACLSLRACSSDSSRHVSITHKKAGGPAGARGSAYSIVV